MTRRRYNYFKKRGLHGAAVKGWRQRPVRESILPWAPELARPIRDRARALAQHGVDVDRLCAGATTPEEVLRCLS